MKRCYTNNAEDNDGAAHVPYPYSSAKNLVLITTTTVMLSVYQKKKASRYIVHC
jgi:hypothetical protein